MNDKDNIGEGNREAARRYREELRETVEETTHEERAEKARDVDSDELRRLRKAERRGRERSRG